MTRPFRVLDFFFLVLDFLLRYFLLDTAVLHGFPGCVCHSQATRNRRVHFLNSTGRRTSPGVDLGNVSVAMSEDDLRGLDAPVIRARLG